MTILQDFAVLNPMCEEDHVKLLQLWQEWPKREIFAHPDYVRLVAIGVGSPRLAVFRLGSATVLYPFVLRDIVLNNQETQSFDIISPYGYSGMFTIGDSDRYRLAHAFHEQFESWCTQNGIVSEFVRMSLFPEELLPYPHSLTHRSENVIVPLFVDEEKIWMSYEAKVRKNVKKALRSNVHIQLDHTGDTLESFFRIFESTLTRREAHESYFHSLGFFQGLSSSLHGNYVYANAIYRDTVVSTELVLISANAIYSFLGGTDASSFEVRPNDLLKHEVCLWARSQGKQYYVLGGGYRKDDGIFRYKKSFAPHGVVPFYSGERIFDQKTYDCLVELALKERRDTEKAEIMDPSFFPLYRVS